ncbi:MAG: hypothetical protein COB14_03855 [Alphaproteobacteria bacterium]|nr:MAG: hypothetical protein COB14_03855 [Alphaproteobacteria bacterium]
MRLILLLGIITLTNISTAESLADAYAQTWTAENVDWQVLRAKDNMGNNACVIRWVYDKTISLSFLKRQENFIFSLQLPEQAPNQPNFPTIEQGKEYYGILDQRGDTINQITAKAISSKTMVFDAPNVQHIQKLKLLEKISLFFTDSIINLPLPNAAENFDAFSQCLDTLDAQTESAKLSPSKKQDLNITAVKNLRKIRDDLTIPPPMPAFKRSKTKASVLDEYKRSERNNNYKEINASLLKKLRILEAEKEGLRKKLLYLTQDAYIADLVACEPSTGTNDDMLNSEMEARYKIELQRLEAENNTLNQGIAESTKNTRELEENLNTCQSFLEKQ